MKNTAQKKCLHCENEFFAKRNSKKYCSDNCKQMAYFKRNGLTLSGANNIAIKDVKQNDETLNVKYNTQTQEQTNETEQLLQLHLANITKQFHQTAETLRQEFNVKYENLKSQPYFTHNDFTITHNAKDDNTLPEKVSYLELLNDDEEKSEEQEAIATQDEYTHIPSKFTQRIEKHCSQSEAAINLQNPQRYYNIDDLIKADWVNVRLLCLVKSLIRLSNYESIDRHTLFCMSDAFIRLSNTKKYNSLPLNYPYGRFIRDYAEQLKSIAKANQHSENIKLKISPEKKAFLLNVNYILSRHYPEIKFSELEFQEYENSLEELKAKWHGRMKPKEV